MEVVLGPGWPGILLHEAIGHGLEADFNRKKTSAFAGLVGQKVASELCTVVDDGTIPFRRGSLNFDDEGNPTHQTILIEKGILQGYLQDRLSADLMKSPLTGNGRRQSYDHIPMPRMTNTFMMSGESAPEDIIKSVKKGLYAVQFGGGQVDITSGKFVFSASEAYLIEDGHITVPVKGATLIGDGPTVLRQVTAVGNDLKLDHGIGVCGKDGQRFPSAWVFRPSRFEKSLSVVRKSRWRKSGNGRTSYRSRQESWSYECGCNDSRRRQLFRNCPYGRSGNAKGSRFPAA
jgi:TldD protein